MPNKLYRGILFLVLMLTLLPLATTQAVEGVASDLYFLTLDANGVMQVWSIGDDNVAEQLTTETGDVRSYDLSFDNQLAYVTARSLVVGTTAVTAGGPLDSAALELVSLSWSPDATRLAVVAINPAGTADASEGIWQFTVADQSWTPILSSTRADAATTAVYQNVDWSPAGDRLLFTVNFAETRGVGLYSFNTGQRFLYNRTDTNGLIDERGYGRGVWTPDASSLLLSDVPNAAVANGYLISANDFTKVVPLITADVAAAKYLSHPHQTRTANLYLLRDFLNSSTTTEIWETVNGAPQQLGAIGTADIADVIWSPRGDAFVYLTEWDGTTGIARLLVRDGDSFGEVTLPSGAERMAAPKWSADLSAPATAGQVSGAVVTQPIFDFTDESGVHHFVARAQWNEIEGTTTYRLNVQPGLDGQTEFDVPGTAVQIGLLPCSSTFTITIGALDATGATGTPSAPVTLMTPNCDAPIQQPLPAVQSQLSSGAASGTAETTADATEDATLLGTAEAPLPETVVTEEPEEPVGPSTVIDLAATEPVAGTTLPDGTILYNTTLSWTAPQTAFNLYVVRIDPPVGVDQRSFFPMRNTDEANTSYSLPISDLVCSIEYSIRVQTLAENGVDVLATSPAIRVSRPACP